MYSPHSSILLHSILIFLIINNYPITTTSIRNHNSNKIPTNELPQPLLINRKHRNADLFHIELIDEHGDQRSRRPTLMDIALQSSAQEGLNAMTELYGKIEPNILKNGQLLDDNHPAALLSKFSATELEYERGQMAAYATVTAAKAFRKNYKYIDDLARQAHSPRISLRRTALEGLCAPRDPPVCVPAAERYRTHDGTCNNKRRLRWGAAQMPFNRFLPPEYGDGVDTVRSAVDGNPLSSSRFVSLLVHGARDGEAALTMMTAQWGQLLDHDVTSTAQPRSINGSVPSCCGGKDFHPSCFPIKVPLDDPWLAPLKVRCLEFLRSAPAQRRDCVLSWREQTNQATSYIDASPIYSNNAKSADSARVFRNGLLVFGRGNPTEDVCQRGALASQCIRSGDGRSGEQPGLLALHHVWVGEHNRIAVELSDMNPHWSDEKLYQETRRIIGAMFQHITYREFLPIILGREVCKLFDLELLNTGYYDGYDPKVNPTVANAFSAAAFRFGHSLVQNSYIRCDRNHNVINSNVSLHEEFQRGDIGSAGSLHRLLRGLATQRVLKRDEFITPELTNHLFQTPGFPFGLDLAAINIQRGRDHGIPPYTSWRVPCGLTAVNTWEDLGNVVGTESAKRISHAYSSVHDIDLFVAGIAERPVIGGLVGPTFACIIAQQFSNSRKGDRFWYENGGFENSFTPAQLHSIRRVSLAQILCRAVGGGTFQPHIFIPAEFPGNERRSCGVGSLAPIDLTPWLEKDPFEPPQHSFSTLETPEKVFDIVPISSATDLISSMQIIKEDKTIATNSVVSVTKTHPVKTQHVNFAGNTLTGIQRPSNSTKINDKLDLKRRPRPSTSTKRPTRKTPVTGVHNKLDKTTDATFHGQGGNRRRTTVTRRTVFFANVPPELRSAIAEGESGSTESPSTMTADDRPTGATKTQKKSNGSTRNDKPIARAEDDATFDPESIDLSSLENSQNKIDGGGDFLEDMDRTLDEFNNATIADRDFFDVFSGLTESETEFQDPTKKDERTKDQTDCDRNETSADRISFTTRKPAVTVPPSATATTELNLNLGVDNQTVPFITKTTERLIREREIKLIPTVRTLTDSSTESPKLNISLSSSRPKHTRLKKTTTTGVTTSAPNSEFRQYQTRPSYPSPQKVVLGGPSSDQYEIEINIRQTNKDPTTRPAPANIYPGYTPTYRPLPNYDRYSPSYLDHNTPVPYVNYFQPPPPTNRPKTRPPTVIYINEHEDHADTTKSTTLLQNFLNLATQGLSGGAQRPISSSSSSGHRDKPILLGHSPHSGHQNTPTQYGPLRPQPQPQGQTALLAASSPSYSQAVASAGNGIAHAASSAVSSGNFGTISGVASAHGADSTFSFNIRPKPSGLHASILPPGSEGGSYGLYSPQSPQKPSYVNLPISTPQYQHQPSYGYVEKETVNTPFSTVYKRPIATNFHSYYTRTHNELQQKEDIERSTPTNHKLDVQDLDLDYSSRTLEPTTNLTSGEDFDEVNYEDYGDEDGEDNMNTSKSFDRDGYLRPEHMRDSLLNLTQLNANMTKNDDDYVLPVLYSTSTLMTETSDTPLTKRYVKENDENFPDILAKHLGNDIHSEDYKDDDIGIAEKLQSQLMPPGLVAFAPIKILTKPERPDNWVIYETPLEKPLLPNLPEVNIDTSAAAEIPHPIQDISIRWLSKYADQKEEGPTLREQPVKTIDTTDEKEKSNGNVLTNATSANTEQLQKGNTMPVKDSVAI